MVHQIVDKIERASCVERTTLTIFNFSLNPRDGPCGSRKFCSSQMQQRQIFWGLALELCCESFPCRSLAQNRKDMNLCSFDPPGPKNSFCQPKDNSSCNCYNPISRSGFVVISAQQAKRFRQQWSGFPQKLSCCHLGVHTEELIAYSCPRYPRQAS